MWNKRRILSELKRLREYWNVPEDSLQDVATYILRHPASVRRDFYVALNNLDLPEIRHADNN